MTAPNSGPPAAGDSTAWGRLVTEYVVHCQAVDGLTAATVRNHRCYLQAYLTWARRSGQDVLRADAAAVGRFLVAEADRGLSARTRRSQLAALRRFSRYLVLQGLSGSDPTTGLSSPRARPPRWEIYTPEQTTAILTHTAGLADLRGRQRHTIVATLRWTGLRSAELRHLRTADLDLDRGRTHVVGKGGRERAVLLPAPLLAVLRPFVRDVRPLLPASPLLLANAHPFVTTSLRGFGQEALSREVELAALGAGVPGRHHPHKWRHTFATELVRSGVDIHVVQRMLGHRSVASTVGYTHLAVEDLAALTAGLWREQT